MDVVSKQTRVTAGGNGVVMSDAFSMLIVSRETW